MFYIYGYNYFNQYKTIHENYNEFKSRTRTRHYYKTLALDIFKTLSLPNEDRGVDGLIYLNKVYNKYVNLVENSSILNQMNKKDNLLVIDPK